MQKSSLLKIHTLPTWIRPIKLLKSVKAPDLLLLGKVRTEAGLLNLASDKEGVIYWASFRGGRDDAKLLARIPTRIAQSLINDIWAAPVLRLAPLGTDFQHAIWAALLEIPVGETRSYADIARAIGHTPRSARAAGGAVGANPIVPFIPCHRVIAASGLIGGYSGGSLAFKRSLLELEGARIKEGARMAA